MNSDVTPSRSRLATNAKLTWIVFFIGIGLLFLTAILDVYRPFDRSWSILYVVVAIYTSWFLRGRLELFLLGSTIAATYLVPMLFAPDMVWGGAGLFYRTTGLIAGFSMLAVMWDRRHYIDALKFSNEELETKVSTRTAELVAANESLRLQIAERLHAEETLRKSSQFRETVIRTAAEGICVCYAIPDYPYVSFSVWNDRMTEITGYTMDEINRLGWYQTLYKDPEVRARAQERMARMRQDDDLRSEEWVIARKDGEERVVAISTSGVETDSGPPGVVALIQDITERKQVEEKLQMMRFCVDNAGESVFWVSPEGRILYINDEACSIHGYSREELLRMSVFDLDVEPDYQPGTWEKHFEALKRHGTITLETRHRSKKGHIFPVEVNANYVHIGDNEFNFAFLRDITERKRIEEEMKASRQRLETLSRQLISTQESEKRHLARELHDEIGQVLTAIKLNLRRTQRAADASLLPYLEENVAMVDQAIGQVRNLALSLRPAQLDELGLVAALHWLVKEQAGRGGFADQLDVDVGDIEIPPDLQTVCFRITQEALTNTIRHGNPSEVHTKMWATDDQLFLSIHDDGVGFDPCEIRRRSLNGSSFGLVSIQERASLVGGQAKIESRPGHGTKIDCWFPLSRH